MVMMPPIDPGFAARRLEERRALEARASKPAREPRDEQWKTVAYELKANYFTKSEIKEFHRGWTDGRVTTGTLESPGWDKMLSLRKSQASEMIADFIMKGTRVTKQEILDMIDAGNKAHDTTPWDTLRGTSWTIYKALKARHAGMDKHDKKFVSNRQRMKESYVRAHKGVRKALAIADRESE